MAPSELDHFVNNDVGVSVKRAGGVSCVTRSSGLAKLTSARIRLVALLQAHIHSNASARMVSVRLRKKPTSF